jgi:hypothetical protein
VANTILRTGPVVHISAIDSDWLWSDTFPQLANIPVQSIQFNGAQQADRCIIKEGSAAGAILFDFTADDIYDQHPLILNGVHLRPVLDFSAGVFTTNSTVIFIFNI